MSSLEDQFLLMRDFFDANKEDADDKTNKLMGKFSSIIDKLIEMVEHMIHHIRIYFPYNDVEDDGLSEMTRSTSETNPFKYDP